MAVFVSDFYHFIGVVLGIRSVSIGMGHIGFGVSLTAVALFIASCKDQGTAENISGSKTNAFDSVLLDVKQLPTTAREKRWFTAAHWFLGLMLLFVAYLEFKVWFF